MVEAASALLEWGSLPQLVRHPFKESKAEETCKKWKMITIKTNTILLYTIAWNISNTTIIARYSAKTIF